MIDQVISGRALEANYPMQATKVLLEAICWELSSN